MAGTRAYHVGVFQRVETPKTLYLCKQCRLPMGHSYGLTDVFVGGNVVSLKAVTQFVKSGKLSTSNDHDDAGSQYQTLSCINCRNVLGRFYHSTPEDLKHKLNQFRIDRKVIRIYHFGEELKHSICGSEAPVTLEKSQVYLDQLAKQKALLEVLQSRLSILKKKVLPPEQETDSIP
ncbi:protein Mis18-alpha-like [Phyllobates terribilis]|uniref:protein Mis18-alpha-like n=1 Tax=Phyllobates terribilis TaxID=111132 RepID=UPI003CCA8A89